MILATYTKQPAEVKDYDIDYSEWLADMNDTLLSAISEVVCTTNPADIDLVVSSLTTATPRIKLWMSGGTSGAKYKVTVRATTTGGRVDESELVFKIKDW